MVWVCQGFLRYFDCTSLHLGPGTTYPIIAIIVEISQDLGL